MVTTRERGRIASTLPAAAALWSVLTIVLGLWWWLLPQHYPFGPGSANGAGTVLAVLPAALVPVLLVVAGAWGLAMAARARSRQPFRTVDPLVLGTGVLYGVVFGLLVPGLAPLVLAGYSMAVLGPIVLFGTVFAGAWRWRGGPAVVAAFALVGAAAWMTGLADGDVLAGYGRLLFGSAAKFGPPAALMVLLVGGVLWAVLAARTVLGARAGEPAPAWTRPAAAARWGRVAVVVAVVCALPYGLLRLTWLTPWPVGIAASELSASPETRLHGLLLGLAALAGAVLTTGLVARWGEVWPRWMPVVRGRRVPVAAAVVPGALVAALFTVAAVPFALMAIGDGKLGMLLVFPFPVWGPALGAAVLAYALRRRGELAGAGTMDGS